MSSDPTSKPTGLPGAAPTSANLERCKDCGRIRPRHGRHACERTLSQDSHADADRLAGLGDDATPAQLRAALHRTRDALRRVERERDAAIEEGTRNAREVANLARQLRAMSR